MEARASLISRTTLCDWRPCKARQSGTHASASGYADKDDFARETGLIKSQTIRGKVLHMWLYYTVLVSVWLCLLLLWYLTELVTTLKGKHNVFCIMLFPLQQHITTIPKWRALECGWKWNSANVQVCMCCPCINILCSYFSWSLTPFCTSTAVSILAGIFCMDFIGKDAAVSHWLW